MQKKTTVTFVVAAVLGLPGGSGGVVSAQPPPALPAAPAGAVTYSAPADWRETRHSEAILFSRPARGDGDSTSYDLLLLPRTAKQGSLQQTFGIAWKELVERRFDTGGHRPFPLPYRTPGGLTVIFDGGYVTVKPDGKPRHVFLYLVDAGSTVVPLLGIENFGFTNLRSSEEKNVTSFFHSLRVPGAVKGPSFTDRAALIGTWQIGSGSSLDFVTPSGAFAGTRVTLAKSTMTLNADSTYSSTLLTMISGDARRPGKIRGRWSLKDGTLVLTPEQVTGDVSDKPVRQRVLAVGVAGTGKTLLVLEGSLSLVAEERSGLPVYEKQK